MANSRRDMQDAELFVWSEDEEDGRPSANPISTSRRAPPASTAASDDVIIIIDDDDDVHATASQTASQPATHNVAPLENEEVEGHDDEDDMHDHDAAVEADDDADDDEDDMRDHDAAVEADDDADNEDEVDSYYGEIPHAMHYEYTEDMDEVENTVLQLALDGVSRVIEQVYQVTSNRHAIRGRIIALLEAIGTGAPPFDAFADSTNTMLRRMTTEWLFLFCQTPDDHVTQVCLRLAHATSPSEITRLHDESWHAYQLREHPHEIIQVLGTAWGEMIQRLLRT